MTDDLTAANDNSGQAVVDGVLARRAVMAASAAPSEDYLAQRTRLARRQRVGGAGPVAANDNQGWPLAEQLRREGNEVLLHVAERYRSIYNAAKFEPRLVGTMPDDFWSPEQRHHVDELGKLSIKGAKGGKRAMPANDGTFKAIAVTEDAWADLTADGPVTFPKRPASPTMRKWTGDDALIAAIDAKPMFLRLQAALGPLVDPFEDAVIGDMTLTDIGRAKGVNTVSRGPVGKVLVMMGLEVVQSEFAQIDREARVIPAAKGYR